MQTDNRYDLLVVAPEKFPLDDGIFLEAQAPLSLFYSSFELPRFDR